MTKPDLPLSSQTQPPEPNLQAGEMPEDKARSGTITGDAHGLFQDRQVHFAFSTRIAIRAACDLLELAPGDEVLAPAYNCGSELDPLLHAGLTVTLYPIGRDLVADPEVIAQRLSSKTRAIYITHYFGLLQPRQAEIRALCDAKGLRLMEDCALSLLSGQNPAEGRTGDVAFFCFHKFFPVLGGGALVVNADDLSVALPFNQTPPRKAEAKFMARQIFSTTLGLDRLRRLKRIIAGTPPTNVFPSLGTDQDIPAHYYFDPSLLGRRMSGLTTRALRNINLREIIDRRRKNWWTYHKLLDQVPLVELLFSDLPDEVSPLSIPVLIPDRDRIAVELQTAGFDVTHWWAGFHQGLDWTAAGDALRLKNEVLALPVDPHLTRLEIEGIVEALAAQLVV